jgi:hypothetical protein
MEGWLFITGYLLLAIYYWLFTVILHVAGFLNFIELFYGM